MFDILALATRSVIPSIGGSWSSSAMSSPAANILQRLVFLPTLSENTIQTLWASRCGDMVNRLLNDNMVTKSMCTDVLVTAVQLKKKWLVKWLLFDSHPKVDLDDRKCLVVETARHANCPELLKHVTTAVQYAQCTRRSLNHV